MLKRCLVMLLSFIAISSTKVDAGSPDANSRNALDAPRISIESILRNLYKKAPPRSFGPANLYKQIQQKPNSNNINPVAASPKWLFPHTPALKVAPKYIKPASSVGVIVTDGSGVKNRKNTWSCTAFCTADDVIATSAHCLAKAKGQGLPTLDGITFHLREYMVNFSKSQVLLGPINSSKLRSVDERNPHLAIYSGYDFNRKSVAMVSNDWAFAKLQRPICRGLGLSFHPMADNELIDAGKKQQIFMIAYDMNNTEEPNVTSPCRIVSRSDAHKIPWNLRKELIQNKAIVIHDCDSREGASGGPIFVNKDGVPQVVAINQGFIEYVKRAPAEQVWSDNRLRVVYKTTKKKFDSATHPGALVEGLKRFREEKLLNSLDEFKEVQSHLKNLHLYDGEIDGLLGPDTKHALIRYEKRAGLVPIGLPTQHLLSLLRSEFEINKTARTDIE